MNPFKISFLFLFLLVETSFAQFPTTKLAQAYQNLIADEQAKYAITSLCILDAKTGAVVFAKNEKSPQIRVAYPGNIGEPI